MARKPKHEEHENHERWLISYADFITLLFAFFVVMYSVSSVNQGKYRVLSESLVAAFRAPNKSLAPIQAGTEAKSPAGVAFSIKKSPAIIKSFERPIPSPYSKEDKKEKAADLKRSAEGEAEAKDPTKGKDQDKAQSPEEAAMAIQTMGDEIEHAMQDLIKADLIAVRRGTFWLEVEINTSILYSSGNARLAPDAVPVLEELAKILTPFPNALHVKGYTDNVPISTLVFPSNWELSAARAASVVTLFAKAGIKPTRLAALGYGEYWPVADNATPEGRTKNRRVVIVVLPGADHSEMSQGVEGVESQQLEQKLKPLIKASAATGSAPVKPEVTAALAQTPVKASAPAPAPATETAPASEKAPVPEKAAASVPVVSLIPGEPLDVTSQEKTEVGHFPVMGLPHAEPLPPMHLPARSAEQAARTPIEPLDVTSQEKTEVGHFPVMGLPHAEPLPPILLPAQSAGKAPRTLGEPLDVTSQEQTETGHFRAIEVPISIPRPTVPRLNLPLPARPGAQVPTPFIAPPSAPLSALE